MYNPSNIHGINKILNYLLRSSTFGQKEWNQSTKAIFFNHRTKNARHILHSPFSNNISAAMSTNTIRQPAETKEVINPSKPLVVIGSANAEIYFEIDKLPKLGETISTNSSQILVGGKGVNQAACGGKLCYPTYFIGHIGDDTNEVVKNAGIVLLQREIPDSVNIQVAKAARNAGVPVLMDAGGMERPTPVELLCLVDILISNETELKNLTGMPTDSYEDISQAAAKCQEMGVKKVLVKRGEKGSVLYVEGEEAIRQLPISTGNILDTTGAGDTFTAAFAVALVEGKSEEECLTFAAAAASLCIQVQGAMPSMPERKAVLNVLQSL
ncbi:hypothetical protein AQUCO_05700039v1 [Aquilegia coerulea]|uniref:Ribokinase n=1 Tax=Aquilegia coerulea TaxID=218851 RepID=A0A2G5CFL1_AQUCA|nr:hypothetical protein AQUCO_05700039v1 [Aquilegia coerulea]